MPRRTLSLLLAAAVVVVAIRQLESADTKPETTRLRQQLVDRGVQYLLTKGQASDGSFSKQAGSGLTSICATALLRSGRGPNDPAVAKSLKFLEGLVREDGGIYTAESTHKNYETSIAIVCFKEANADGRYDKIIKDADRFIKNLQWDAGEGADKSHFNYGGAGYGRKGRPDLSNTSFLMDALVAAGNGPDDPAVQAALVFVSRAKPGERTQHDAVCRQDQRRRFLLHTGQRRRELCQPGGRSAERAAQLRLDELRRLEEHDLCGPQARRSAREGRTPVAKEKLQRCRQPGPRRPGSLLLLPHDGQVSGGDG